MNKKYDLANYLDDLFSNDEFSFYDEMRWLRKMTNLSFQNKAGLWNLMNKIIRRR